MRRIAAVVLAIGLGGVIAQGQSVHFRGKVEDDPVTNQFVVDCTNTKLTSTTVNLNDYLGQQVEATGDWNGSSTSPSVKVTAITIVPRTFEIGGNGKIGGELTFEVTGTPGDFTVMLIAGGPSFIPSKERGVFFLDPTPLIKIGSGTIPGGGTLQIQVKVPNDPIFVGLVVLGQAAVASPTGRVLHTNPDCKTISS